MICKFSVNYIFEGKRKCYLSKKQTVQDTIAERNKPIMCNGTKKDKEQCPFWSSRK